MAKPEWGSKHTCEKCGARFYDLGRVPAVCPTCGTEWSAPKGVRPKREPAPAAAPVVAEPAPPEAAEAEAPEAAEEGNDVEADPEIAGDEAEDAGETFPQPKE